MHKILTTKTENHTKTLLTSQQNSWVLVWITLVNKKYNVNTKKFKLQINTFKCVNPIFVMAILRYEL
jgi:hypothetical protein